MLRKLSKLRLSACLATAVVVSGVLPAAVQAEEVPQGLLDILPELSQQWGTDPVIIAAVKAQNAKSVSLAEIQSLDQKWQSTSGLAGFMLPFFDNPAVEALTRLEKEAHYVVESFAMDNQGAIVAATNKTSDYWQGDEAKFTESFKDGKGAVHTGEVEFDESAQAYLVQVSVPVMSDGEAIGAVTIGVDIGSWYE